MPRAKQPVRHRDSRTRVLLAALPVVAAISAAAPNADAAPRTWIGGNTQWVEGIGNNSNWSPADEPDIDDEAIFNTSNGVDLGSNNSVLHLTMSGGIDLGTNGNDLTVDGLVSLTGASTNLIVGGGTSTLVADNVAISSSAVIELDGGELRIIEETGNGLLTINSTAVLIGNGAINMNDGLSVVTTLINNNGTISARSDPLFFGNPPPAGTLSISAASSNARIDLDGSGENGVVNVFRNQTLNIGMPLADGFAGDINLFHNSSLDMPNWQLLFGTIDVDNGFVDSPLGIPDVPAGVAFLKGGSIDHLSGAITVADPDGTLQFDAPYVMNGTGNLVNNGLVVFNNNATIGSLGNFTMPTARSSITVNAGVTVTVNQANFNADGGGFATNVITIHSGGELDLNLGVGGDAVLQGTINLHGGTLDVTTNTGSWTIDGALNAIANTGTSTIQGNSVTLSGPINVGVNSILAVTTPNTTLAAGGTIAAGATLVLTGQALFVPNNGAANAQFTGTGTFVVEGDAVFNEATTINMVGGTVDLDGRDTDLQGNLIVVRDPLTINAAAVSSFGKVNSANENGIAISNSLDTGTLTVILDSPSTSWTINAPGVISLSNDNAPATLLAGSALVMNGTMFVTGDVRTDARLDIGGTININTAGEPLRLNGGNQSISGANRLSGGVTQGAGILGADSARALMGFGTINTTVDFGGTASLLADDGILTINGAIVDVSVLGTAHTDGILNIPPAWNTNIAEVVQMSGGEIRGGAITNDDANGITGFGLVSARVINNTLINAGGGTLILETALDNNDWDGSTNTGELRAHTGSLTIRDDGPVLFLGTVTASPSRTVFADGFELDFNPGSTLNLTGGTYRQSANISTDLGGAINVNAGPESTLASDAGTGVFNFEATSTTTLDDVLRLNSNVTIQAGATFTGGGTLRNLATRRLAPANGADIDVFIQNQGIFAPAGAGQGRVDVKDFEQTGTGRFEAQIAGTGLAQFDRLVVNGIAQLGGTLDVDLAGVPALGQSFNIISALGGVSGSFSTVTQPDPRGLLNFVFTPSYQPTIVALNVTRAFYEVQNGPYPDNFSGTGIELIKTTGNTATLTGVNTYTGSTTVIAGTLIFQDHEAVPAGELVVEASATAQLLGGFTRSALLTGLTIQPGGRFDLTNNDLVIDNGDLIEVSSYLAAGRLHTTVPTAHTTLGVLKNDKGNGQPRFTTFNGVAVDINDVLVKFTYEGDTNLDGKVSIADFLATDRGFARNLTGWGNGDINFSGAVDGADFFLMDQAFLNQGAPLTGPRASAAAAVPEPAAALGLLIASLLGLKRRRT